jgi:hypothetical protein
MSRYGNPRARRTHQERLYIAHKHITAGLAWLAAGMSAAPRSIGKAILSWPAAPAVDAGAVLRVFAVT